MGYTLVEKIFAQRIGREAKAGEFVVAPVDLLLAHEGTGPLALEQFEALGRESLATTTLLFCDHATPSPRKELANVQKRLRTFAVERGAHLFEPGSGICHQVVAEQWAKPGHVSPRAIAVATSVEPIPVAKAPRAPAVQVWESAPMMTWPGLAHCSTTTW